MSDIVVRGARDSRWKPGAEPSEAILEHLIAATIAGDVPLRLLVVVAHPDDEAIGAGALLANYPDATVAHLTDGGGLNEATARSRGYRSREEYADTRRREVVASLALVGIPPSRVRSLGIPDGAAGHRLVASCRAIMDLMDDVAPDVVLTHPYEGGHSDHDAAAFGVHLAAGLLRREGERAPIILELTSYHHANGRRVRGRFLPYDGVSVHSVVLGADERRRKASMFAAFESQRAVLEQFSLHVERFRVAPRYLFTAPPHAGVLDYERFSLGFTGGEWRAQAARALAVLRARARPKRRREG